MTRVSFDTAAAAIEIEMVLPTGDELRPTGQLAVVSIDRDLVIKVRAPSGRVIVTGAWNLISVCWESYLTEIAPTAMEMIDARVEATVKLFERGRLPGAWLNPRARYEAGVGF
jgi:hypothetical protein